MSEIRTVEVEEKPAESLDTLIQRPGIWRNREFAHVSMAVLQPDYFRAHGIKVKERCREVWKYDVETREGRLTI
ncbi:MAG: hypothetical protein Q8R18_01630, partial [bacterium]|nr:hypothetical protein [bacterium]